MFTCIPDCLAEFSCRICVLFYYIGELVCLRTTGAETFLTLLNLWCQTVLGEIIFCVWHSCHLWCATLLSSPDDDRLWDRMCCCCCYCCCAVCQMLWSVRWSRCVTYHCCTHSISKYRLIQPKRNDIQYGAVGVRVSSGTASVSTLWMIIDIVCPLESD